MTRSKLALAASLVALVFVGSAAAQDTVHLASQPADVDSRFAALSAELANLQTRLSQVEGANYAPIAAPCCDRSVCGWYGGFELVIVRPHFQNPTDFRAGTAFLVTVDSGDDDVDGTVIDVGTSGGGDPVSIQPTYNFQATPRIFLGWRNDEGLGIRTRYWILDADSDPLVDTSSPSANDVLTQSLNLQALDFEVTQHMFLNWYELEFGGGVRYAHVNTATTIDPNNAPLIPTRLTTNFDGIGPTAALSLRRPLGMDNFALLGNVRGSLLFGESNYRYEALLDGDDPETLDTGESEFTLLPVFETQIGLERNWWTENGRWCLCGMFEAQWWGGAAGGPANDHSAPNSTIFRTDNSLGAIGGTVSIMYEH